ncbi:MAG: sigma 54-interacting transcriptional regulator [Oleibacter sp.]|nr:sigma 54-interacting transcriptional regulator [Thalassolituus sp.]
MSVDTYFQQAALPLCVLDTRYDQFTALNAQAQKTLGGTVQTLKPSQIFAHCWADFITFTQNVLHHGQAWTDTLSYQDITTGTSVPLEIWGKRIEFQSIEGQQIEEQGHESHQLSLVMHDANHLDAYRTQGELDRHYASGFPHWQRATQVFLEFERENQLLLEAAGEGIYGVDLNGMTTFVNPAAQRMLGYSAQELAGRNMHTAVHHHHQDGRHYDAQDCPIFSAFRDGEVREVDDDIFWCKDGSSIQVEYTSTPIRDQGVIIGAVVIFRDITQKKASHQRLLEALNEVQHLKNQLEIENAYLHEALNEEFNHHQIVGNSAEIHRVIEQINLVATTQATVLIHGESGTGKELIARAIHDLSHRAERPMIRVNCAAIPAELFESEFFGHIKGAFTGASADRIGRFELAHGGTLFLDEIGEIPLALQGKLLRVLQEQQFERVGDDLTRHVDVRIMAATNRDLKSLVEKRLFREDLYFRLNVFPIESVPLRRRKDDIPMLTQHFLARSCQRANKPLMRIPLTELYKLKDYDWPGNIRELENVIEREVILNRGETLHFQRLKNTGSTQQVIRQDDSAMAIMTEDELIDVDKKNILSALKHCRGKVSGEDGAAVLLGLKPTTLASRIKKYAIEYRSFK